MDFWAQHKDFVLKVLAGFGVFLVALIARSITYGDELEEAQLKNRNIASKVRRKKLAPMRTVGTLEQNARKLEANARSIASEIGWDANDPELGLQLIRRTLSYLPRFKDADEATLDAEARVKRDAIQDNLNGGFGELRLLVREDLVDEANVQNIRVNEGVGFEAVVDLQPEDLFQYLLQLEVTARIIRYAIDERVDAIEEVRIDTRRTVEVIPGANPDFLREFPVEIRFRCSQVAMFSIFNRLESDRPVIPWRELRIDRADRPRDHVIVQLTVLAVAANVEVPFAATVEEETQ